MGAVGKRYGFGRRTSEAPNPQGLIGLVKPLRKHNLPWCSRPRCGRRHRNCKSGRSSTFPCVNLRILSRFSKFVRSGAPPLAVSRRFAVAAAAAALLAAGIPWLASWRIRAEIRAACEPANPAIEAVAAVIRRQHATELEQVALVELAANHLLDYDQSGKVYGPGIPTVSEMLSRRRLGHWLYPRGDCKEHAVIAGSLLSALGIRWTPAVSFPLGHAWVRVELPNGAWDILAAPVGNWDRLGSTGLSVVSLLAGGSAVPIRAPSAELARESAYRLISRRLAAPLPSWQDAALLGVVIVTPRGVYNHAPLDFTEPAVLRTAGEVARRAQVSGFPFGEPL